MRVIVGTMCLVIAGNATAQSVPDNSQALRVHSEYRRTPGLGIDPFRYVMMPRWGLVLSTRVAAQNNVLNMEDIGAFTFLADTNELGVGEIIDATGLVPSGSGLGGRVEAAGRVHLGLSFGRRVTIGLSAGGEGFGSFDLEDGAVALLRDGNSQRDTFSLGDSRLASIATVDAGGHVVVRLDPIAGVDGAQITLGAGARQVRPVFYASVSSSLADGGRLIIPASGANVEANIALEAFSLPLDDSLSVSDYLNRGTGLALDFLARVEWPHHGLAIEAMVANIGTMTIEGVEHRTARIQVQGSSIDEIADAINPDTVSVCIAQDPTFDPTQNCTFLDTLTFDVQQVVSSEVTLPRILRFTVSAWANRILQIDVAATAPVSGEFETPLTVSFGTTWRLVRSLPLRAGIIAGGDQGGLGFTGGFAVETKNLLLQFYGASLGGLFRRAKGAGGRFEFGFFF